jgi:uncharacterized protein with PIN domain
LAERRGPARRLFIKSDYYHEQVRQVLQACRLDGETEVFSRCLRCNTLLRTVSRQLVAGKVPSYVYGRQMTFKQCSTCNRFYWGGTHRDNMLRQLRAMLGSKLPTAVNMPPESPGGDKPGLSSEKASSANQLGLTDTRSAPLVTTFPRSML